ncbi:bifunctional adenosylcobinamide kinase/adenosylcobinamide-phosphate guanylyltransferase [Arenicella chitinivorans]|uniref:bifunctional adenosylcobinamide kinase/adenosylcobinamide-phosphate guanylyltransferase n=1 Tax=Arenicella chitinivorans TaxID=1329800 RepID=UPI001674275F
MKHLILGGARSGKSRYAEGVCSALHQQHPETELIYIATATADDSEMAKRIEQHQRRRGSEWQLRECAVELGTALSACHDQSIVLIDCLTLWLSNCLHRDCWPHQRAALLNAVHAFEGTVIMVSNEVGGGIVPLGQLSREFVDQSGWLHQSLAAQCSEVSLVVAGLPLSLKQPI